MVPPIKHTCIALFFLSVLLGTHSLIAVKPLATNSHEKLTNTKLKKHATRKNSPSLHKLNLKRLIFIVTTIGSILLSYLLFKKSAIFTKKGNIISTRFPYLFTHFGTFEYDGETYYQRDVSKDGDCWSYTGWLAYWHMLNKCQAAYNDFPKILKQLAEQAKVIGNNYQKWINNLQLALKDLEDPQKQGFYINTYLSVINYYKKELNNFTYPNLLYSLLPDTAPHERYTDGYLKGKTYYNDLMGFLTKAGTPFVLNRMKEPWCKYIRWFPAMGKVLSVQRKNYNQLTRSIIQEIHEKLHQNEKSAIQYITNHVVKVYLRKAQEIKNCSKEVVGLVPLICNILKEGHQYAGSLQKQLLWLKRNPDKLAKLMRFIRVCDVIFENLPNPEDPLLTFSNFSSSLKKGTYGRIASFQRLGLYIGNALNLPTIQDRVYPIYYKKGEQKIPVKSFMVISSNRHDYHAVTQEVWEGNQ